MPESTPTATPRQLSSLDEPRSACGDAGVRTAVRVLRLLRLLNAQPSWTLHALHLETGLPKATLSRLLSTLEQEGYARSELPAGTWRVAAGVRALSHGYGSALRLVDLGRPLLVRLTRRVKWPLAIGVVEDNAIVVRLSTLPYSPLAMQTTRLGRRLGLTTTALGRAHLAFCDEATRQCLLDRVWPVDSPEARRQREWAEHDLAQVRRAGYAVRMPNAEKASATLAVPVGIDPEGAIGALCMTTFGSLMTPALIAQHVPTLQHAAAELASAFGCAAAAG